MDVDSLRNALAALEYKRWVNWQRYVHSLGRRVEQRDGNGDLIIPKDDVERWERQIETAYEDLSPEVLAENLEMVEDTLRIVLQFCPEIQEREKS